MRVYHVLEKIENFERSIFLAGPTPRNNNTISWRLEALEILKNLNFDGSVLVPEHDKIEPEYKERLEWEYNSLHFCSLIVFWIPRSELLPGYTTNVEFGYWIKSNKIIYGRPNHSIKNRYLDWLYTKETGKKPINNLQLLLEGAKII